MEPCICCGVRLSARQRNEHLRIRAIALNAYLNAMEEDPQEDPPDDVPDGWDEDMPELEDEIDMFDEEFGDEEGDGMDIPPADEEAGLAPRDNSPAFDGANPAPRDNSPAFDEARLAPDEVRPAIDEIGPAPENAGPRRQVVDLTALIAREDNDAPPSPPRYQPINDLDGMDLDGSDDDDDLFVPPPFIPPEPGVLRNPPVAIDDWGSDEEPVDFGPLDDGSSVGSAEQERERELQFEEWDEPLGIDADIEPEMDDQEMWDFLHRRFGDLAEAEWVDLYDRFLTGQDEKSLPFLAARLRTHFSRATYEDLRNNACATLGLPI
ncbi:hypothetical protein FRC07_000432 [Ceratobasidium sp. 392]|nr:hypothetical protein FRC07_000432 [Ceratobasidium sp. 392]